MKTMLKKTLTTLAFALGLTTFAFGEAVETVAYWHKDFANGSVKNGFTMSLGEGTTVNADGTVTLAKQTGSSAPATHGVEISFTDDQGNSVFPGYELTVIVKYSGLDFTTSRFPFLSTIWGDNKDAAESVLSARNKNQMYYETGVTPSEKSGDTAMSDIKQAIPTSGYMVVSLSGYESGTIGCAGTRIGFASGEGDFLDYGYNSGLKYTGKSFYGIKVGGTVGKINDFYRPGMKVEGVAIVKGFTTTMKTFRYLFPDECYRFDYAGATVKDMTETKYLSGLTVKNIKDAVFSAKVVNNSVEWANGMVTACQKAFTPAEGDPTKVALQYHLYNKDYYKSADIYFTDKTDGIYFKKTGGRYNSTTSASTKPTTPPADNKLGTDDATWSSKSANYNFNDFSVYVPYTQTATATTGDWSALGWTGDDIARLDVTDDATLTVDAASAVGVLKATGTGKLTLKYADAAKLIAGKNWDFTEATGKVAFDCADVEFEGQVVLMSGTIKGKENIDADGSSLPENTVLIVSDTAVILNDAYTTTVEGEKTFSELKWVPEEPPTGFGEDAVFVIKNTDAATLTFTENLTASRLIAENTAALTLQTNEASVAIGAFDFRKADVVLTFNPGAATFVIGEDKTLTMKASGLKKSLVTNHGTIKFEGGEADDPIEFQNDVNGEGIGTVVLADDTYVKCTQTVGDCSYDVTGAGENSRFEVTRDNGWAIGLVAGSTFHNLTYISSASDTQAHWLAKDGFDATVDLEIKSGDINGNGNNITIRSLEGAGAVKNGTFNIVCGKEATYSGTSAEPFVIGGTEVQTISGAYTGMLTVNAGATVKLAGSAAPSSISGEGTVIVDASVTTLNIGTARPTTTFTFEGATEVHYTENIVDDGHVYELTLEGGETPTYKVYDVNGNEKEVVEGVYVPGVSGKVAWYDFTFTNTLKSVGTDTTTLTRDYSYGLPKGTSAYISTSNAIFTAIDGYMAPTYPTEWSASVYAKVPKVPNAVLMAFGTNAGGSIALIAGNTNDNEIVLARTTGNTPYETLATMKVPNAFTTPHLYSFCKSDKEIKIYLDDALWSTYKSESAISFGSGFQLGSLHGGVHATGFVQYGKTYYDAEVEANNSTVVALRMYDVVLGPNAIKSLAKEFPYVSPNGSFSRTLPNEKQAFWMADGQWTNDKTQETASMPDAESAVKLTGVTATEVLVNLAADTVYESITLNGDPESVLTIKAGGFPPFPGQIKAEGLVTVNAPVWLDRTAIDISGVPLTVTENGAITFDLSAFNFGVYFEDTYVPLTGMSAKYDDQIFAALPQETPNREVTFGYDSATQTYGLTITVDKTIPFVYTIDESEETGVWTWDKQVVDEATVLAMSKADIVKKGTGTQSFVGQSKFNYTVDAGTLRFTSKVDQPTSSITINKGATFDLNGIGAFYHIVLAGGALVNNGADLKTNNHQFDTLVLTADSTLGGTGNFDFIRNGHGASVLDLGGHKLTKTGDNDFWFDNGIVTNGTVIVNGGRFCVGISNAEGEHKFVDATIEIGADGEVYISNHDVTISSITGVEGAVLDGNGGKLIGCTLKGNITLAEDVKGLCDATNPLTLDGTTINLGQNRALVFAGSGTVNAVLTAAEIAKEGPITVFTATEGATVTGGTVVDEDGKVVPGSFTGGSFQVDHEAKIGDVYYLTLQDALDVGGDVTLLTLVTGEYTIAEGKTVNLDLGVYSITAKAGRQAINNYGTLTINNGAVTAGEAAIVLWGGSTTTINGGSYQSTDNAVIMGSGNDGEGNVSLTINGGLFTGGITTAGYIACGVYVPNSGTYAIKGGTFAITGGCGVCARAGTTKIDSTVVFNVTGSGTGKVGDKGGVPAGVDVFFDYSEPAYPGYAEGDAIFAQSTALKTADGQGWFGPEENYYKLAKTDTAEAKIGDVYYATLQDALDVGGDVELLTLVTGEYTIAAGKTVNLDLGGYSITANAGRQAINNYGTLTINNGAVTAGEAAIVLWGNSVTTIEGGSYQSTDNAVIMGSGNDGEGSVTLAINGGMFTGGITTAGYIACGVYVPNSGTYAIKGGTFNITGGCGVCARAGTTKIDSTVVFNVTGSGTGKVGDKGGVPAGVDVFFDYSEPAYPGYAEGDAIWSQSNTLKTDAEQEWSTEQTAGYYKLQAKSPIQPVEPGEPIDVPTGADPEKFVAGVEANKATLLKAPENVLSGTELTAYQALFTATLSPEGTTVNFELNETGTNTVEVKTAEAKTDALDVALSEESELTISEPLPGFYYSLKQGGDVKDLGFNDPGDQDKLAGKVDIKFNLVKPENAGFYQTIITPTPTK